MTWTVLSECLIGTSHRARNVVCQDSCRYSTFGDDGEWMVIAIADGAGSASHADIGANLVCDELVQRIVKFEPPQLVRHDCISALIGEVRASLFLKAESLGVRARELASTALLAIVGPSSSTFAQIGDGAIVLGAAQTYRVVFWPEPTEYVNATDFLTDETFAERIQFDVVNEPVVEVAVLTDGLQRIALDFASRSAYSGFFEPMFKELRAVSDANLLAESFRSFLDSDRVNQRTDDDKTLLLAVRSK